jgi:predicted phage baseplate assembly protein
VEWKELPSFYGQAANAHIFVTREDENNRTHVLFGDGINGARLPSGSNNIVAKYRYGSGADTPDAGQLTVITQPQPNLKGIRNPVAVGGGADPDSPKKIKRYAPQSVLTFGRAVSGDDYETIAVQAPGVARARAYWALDPDEQRTLVKIYVGDNDSAVNAAKVALAHADDPNRPVRVRRALAIPITLSFTLRIDPTHVATDVIAAARAAMLDDDTGLFGINVVRIGQPVYQSQIYASCQAVPGILAVHSLLFLQDRGHGFEVVDHFRYDPGEGGFFQLQSDNLIISQEVSENAG